MESEWSWEMIPNTEMGSNYLKLYFIHTTYVHPVVRFVMHLHFTLIFHILKSENL